MAVRLLIVDPECALLECYCAYFDRVGLETTWAAHWVLARELYTQRAPQAVVLEPDLPGDGCDRLLEAIAEQTDRRPLPIIVVSRRASHELEYPVHGYHVKPVAMTVLLQDIFAIAGCDPIVQGDGMEPSSPGH